MIDFVQSTVNKMVSLYQLVRFSNTCQYFIAIFFLFLFVNVSAQDTLKLRIKTIDKNEIFVKENIEIDTIFTQLPILENALNQLITNLQSKAYLTASVDSISKQGNRVEAYIFVGEKYRWAKLINGNIEAFFLSKIGFRE